MLRFTQLRILLCFKIFFGLCNAATTNFQYMICEDRESFFGTTDCSVPPFQLAKLKNPLRSKRTAQATLSITFEDSGTNSTVIMSIVEGNNLIGQNITGIWYARFVPNGYHNVTYTPKPDLFDSIGTFDFYQNVDDASAVTRFKNSEGEDTYWGMLKHKYVMRSLPARFKSGIGDVTHEYFIYGNSTENQDDTMSIVIFRIPLMENVSHFRRRRHDRSKRQAEHSTYTPNVVYPKLIISTDYMTGRYEFETGDFIKQLIAYLNVVDMVFRKLRDPEVRLRITGIIIPKDPLATPYMTHNARSNIPLNTTKIMIDTIEYFVAENNRFPNSSYDVIIAMPSNNLISYNGLEKLAGIATTVGSTAIVKYTANYIGVSTMVHELGHLFGVIDHDGEGTSAECSHTDGHIMAHSNDLSRSLTWSICSQQAMRSYFRSKEAANMYERPNEMSDVDKLKPDKWLSICGQCQNLIGNEFHLCTVQDESCESRMCLLDGNCITSIQRNDNATCSLQQECYTSKNGEIIRHSIQSPYI